MVDTIRLGASRSIVIADGIRAAAARTPEKIAIVESGRRLSYCTLVERIDRVAYLAHGGLGLRHGDFAAVLSPNRLEYMEIVCGLSSAGVPVATIGPAAPPAEIRFVCDDARARVLFVAPELEEAARAAAPASVERFIVLGDAYEALLARSSAARCTVSVSETDVFSVPYTSGATGRADVRARETLADRRRRERQDLLDRFVRRLLHQRHDLPPMISRSSG